MPSRPSFRSGSGSSRSRQWSCRSRAGSSRDCCRAEAWNWWWAFHSVERFADKLIGDNLDYYFNAFFDLHAHDSSALSALDRATFVEVYSRPLVLSAALGWFRAFLQDVEDNREWLQVPLEVP